ncbi:methyltransferase family protein [Aureimonas leprariae]|uniref:Isoprenylcysteine carboxylmethyltransferase family protein n=1 Tax=Plantimonas leprariae TaxID=2615207 RepID=A0A7V7PSY4_9HYPH|nr:isoprenylcysteine carboxylmethyltransferase family protein [Aureimonas leprariae]KAB0682687.1 isoprenylcysteine carboxylmethyltransferase family protein [Aureimonas leprariae]
MTLSEFQHLRRLLLIGLVAIAFLCLLFVRSAWTGDTHETIEAAGMGLIVVGIAGRLWCTLYIGGRKAAEIVDIGPYSVCRNPLYVFSSIAACGVGAQTGSVAVAAFFLLGCALAFQIVIRREEGFLAEAFGEAYRQYLGRVPRFWPNFRLYADSATITVTTSRVRRTLIDALPFFAAMPAFEAVEYLQGTGAIHVALRLY